MIMIDDRYLDIQNCKTYSLYCGDAEFDDFVLQEDMRTYDMDNVTMTKKGLYLALVVPGLAERRPSLVHGDYMHVKLACEAAGDKTLPYKVCAIWKILYRY